MKRPEQFPLAIAPKASQFRLRIRRSRIHGVGVFALQPIPAGVKVIEYTGERLSRQRLLERVRATLRRRGRVPRYIFGLNRYWFIDGERNGCGAERINHCCDPNLRRHITADHIFLFSRRRIAAGEELTFDYRYRATCPRMPCRCGSPKCRGTVNLYEKS
jgi:uncharacterized protein